MTKRFIDIFLSVSVLIFFFPFITAALVFVFFITGENPVIIHTRRISLNKKRIRIFKIRTIKNSKEFKKLEENSRQIFIKSGYSDFVPPFCRWLRKTGLDEILQVINVLKGDMSFIGPRPFLETDLITMKNNDFVLYLRRETIRSKPGITGYWQIYGDRTNGISNLIELDELYEKKKSVSFDLKILFKTFFILLTASHSDSIVTERIDIQNDLYTHLEPEKLII